MLVLWIIFNPRVSKCNLKSVTQWRGLSKLIRYAQAYDRRFSNELHTLSLRHLSLITYHLSLITYHLSFITCHLSLSEDVVDRNKLN
jgi:hypothetical protein